MHSEVRAWRAPLIHPTAFASNYILLQVTMRIQSSLLLSHSRPVHVHVAVTRGEVALSSAGEPEGDLTSSSHSPPLAPTHLPLSSPAAFDSSHLLHATTHSFCMLTESDYQPRCSTLTKVSSHSPPTRRSALLTRLAVLTSRKYGVATVWYAHSDLPPDSSPQLTSAGLSPRSAPSRR